MELSLPRAWRSKVTAFTFFVFVLTGEVRAGIRLRGNAVKRVASQEADLQTVSGVRAVESVSSLLLRKDSAAPAYQVLSAASSSVQPPQILSQPEDIQVQGAGEVTLSVDAYSAGGALTYLWYKDGVSTGVKTPTLTVSVRSDSGLGYYRCKVSNSKYAVYSRSALVSWGGVPGPAIDVQPVGGAKPIGSVASLNVGASGVDLSYQWVKDGVVIDGATDPVLKVVVKEALAKYACEVSASGSSKTTSSAVAVSSLASSFGGVAPLDADVNANFGALLQVAVTSTGLVTGKIVSTMGISTFRGALEFSNGRAVIGCTASKGEVLQLALSEDGGTLEGTVERTGSSVAVELKRCPWRDPGASLASFTGVYNVSLEALEATSAQPQGSGWSTLSIAKVGGSVALYGSLADGTPVSLSTSVSGAGEIPVFCSLYGGKGSLVGTLEVQRGDTSPSGNLAEGRLVWSKGNNIATRAGQAGVYSAGFDALALHASGGYYVVPQKGLLFLAANPSTGGLANLHLELKEATLGVDIAADGIVSGIGTTNSVRFVSNPASIKLGSVNLKTGIINGTVAVPGETAGFVKASTFSGVAIPQAAGFVVKGYVLIPKADAAIGKVNLSERVSGVMAVTALGR